MRTLEELKELNSELGINNDYLEGKKPYDKMTPMEQCDYDKYFPKVDKEMYKFDSEAFIKELEEMNGIEDTPLEYEDYELYMEVEEIRERDIKGDI